MDQRINRENFAICMQKKDARIIVVHQLNQGVSAVRNVGIKKAHGEYIIFVDVDDFLERDMINELVKCTVNNCLTVGGII